MATIHGAPLNIVGLVQGLKDRGEKALFTELFFTLEPELIDLLWEEPSRILDHGCPEIEIRVDRN